MHRLDREFITSGGLADAIRDAEERGLLRIATPAERARSRRHALRHHPDQEDIWLFAYGSLLWNPTFEFAEHQPGRIFGLHRSFCQWGHAGRGSPDNPTLILALDRGGSCQGVVYRIPRGRMDTELEVIWGREMIALTYRPTWVNVHTEGGVRRALTFAANRDHDRYAGRLPMRQVATILARAQGILGTSAQYLHNTVDHLDALGITDTYMSRLSALVRAGPE